MMKIKNRKQIKKFLSEFKDRTEAYQQSVLKTLSDNLVSELSSSAPKADPTLQGYEKKLDVVQVSGRNKAAGVVYQGPKQVLGENQDPDTTLIYIVRVQKKTKRNQDLFGLLKNYEPFTFKTWPEKIKKNDFELQYKKAREADVRRALECNEKAFEDLASDLTSLGIAIPKSDKSKEVRDFKRFPDLVYKIIQHELRLRGKAEPSWKPSLKKAQSKGEVKKLLKDAEVMKILTDPNFMGWVNAGKIHLKLSEQSAEALEDFVKALGLK